jgi:hypothetical protein
VSINGRLARALKWLDLTRRCSGPRVEIYTGTRAELDALPLPTVCNRCGRPLAQHPPGVHFVFALTDAYAGGPGEAG